MPATPPTTSATLEPALGAGVGLRWRSPVGPLRLDWAWGDEVRTCAAALQRRHRLLSGTHGPADPAPRPPAAAPPAAARSRLAAALACCSRCGWCWASRSSCWRCWRGTAALAARHRTRQPLAAGTRARRRGHRLQRRPAGRPLARRPPAHHLGRRPGIADAGRPARRRADAGTGGRTRRPGWVSTCCSSARAAPPWSAARRAIGRCRCR